MTTEHAKIRILFIEDDPSWQQIGRRILSDIDPRFLVRTASAAAAAIEILEASSGFQLIISDYFLEGSPLTGLDISKFCTSRNNPTPFIIFSGRNPAEIEADAGSALSVPVISKISSFKEIRDAFSVLLKPMFDISR